MQEEPVVFTSTVEGLMRALGTHLDERTHQRFADIGLPMKGKLQATYPREAWLKAGHLASSILFPMLPPEQAQVALGRRFVHGFSETIVGSALTRLMRILGPRRALGRLEQNLRVGNNYSQAALRETATGLELDISDAPFPGYYQGMVEAVLELAGSKEFQVTQLRRQGNETTFKISYS